MHPFKIWNVEICWNDDSNDPRHDFSRHRSDVNPRPSASQGSQGSHVTSRGPQELETPAVADPRRSHGWRGGTPTLTDFKAGMVVVSEPDFQSGLGNKRELHGFWMNFKRTIVDLLQFYLVGCHILSQSITYWWLAGLRQFWKSCLDIFFHIFPYFPLPMQ